MSLLRRSRPVYYFLLAALVLLLVIQYFWLQYTYQLKERDFDDKVRLSLRIYNDVIQEDSTLVRSMKQVWNDRAGLPKVLPTLQYSIDTFFTNNSIPTDYVFGIGQSKQQIFWSSDTSYTKDINQSKFTIIGLCMDKLGSLYISFIFPGKTSYILTRLLPLLLLAAFSLLLLVSCFFNLAATIRRQVKLAEMKTDFINNMTHEFKTPLFTISIASRMLGEQESVTDDEKNRNYLQTIRSETARLNNLVEKVLQTARLTKQQLQYEKKSMDLHEVIHTTVNSFQVIAGERNGTIEVNLDAAVYHIYADPVHISNTLYNLLDNAFKYTNTNPHIILSTKNSEDSILFSIKDNGIGLDTVTRKLIFERFYRAHTGDLHNVKGYGIGLSYARSVVEAYGGMISVNSIVKKGSEFIIQLPVISNGQ